MTEFDDTLTKSQVRDFIDDAMGDLGLGDLYEVVLNAATDRAWCADVFRLNIESKDDLRKLDVYSLIGQLLVDISVEIIGKRMRPTR